MRGGVTSSALVLCRWENLGAQVALDVALGLEYLHTRSPPLMHRDLKSPNVRGS